MHIFLEKFVYVAENDYLCARKGYVDKNHTI